MANREETKQIKFFKGVKYLLAEDVWIDTGIIGFSGGTKFVTIYVDGWLHMKAGWGWDGASGPTIDTKTSMRGSVAHDGNAMLMRQGIIDNALWELNDNMLERINKEDGMNSIRAILWTKALKMVNGKYAKHSRKRKVYTAP